MEKSPVESFDYQTAFSRNYGWLNEEEQLKLKQTHVGLIGLGGVGGQYAEILARLGIGRFTIYDGDQFSIENSNRQNQCSTSNYGKNKAEVIGSLIKDINPSAHVKVVSRHLQPQDIEEFCQSIDIYLDSLDFFEIELRRKVFIKMRNLGKTSLTAAPIGTGSSLLVFTPDSMSFDDYFGFHRTEDIRRRSIMFLIGLSPTLKQIKYLKVKQGVNFGGKKAPSLPMGVYSCASAAATAIFKLVLKRGEVYKAPWTIHYDPFLNNLHKKYLWLGYKNPIQQIKYHIALRQLKD